MESLNVARKTICLPFPSEEQYQEYMKDGKAFREFLNEMYEKHPELFPEQMAGGFVLQGFTTSQKQEGFCMRRIKLGNGEVYQVRPSFMMPYMIGKTDEVEKALFLRRWGVPFEALAYVFGHDAMYWYRAYTSLGRNSIVGTTIKDPDLLPDDVGADEKHSRLNGEKILITTTAAQECILGVGVAENAGTDALTEGYRDFKEEARNLNPDYEPETVNTDGWQPTQRAWMILFPGITLILCFLHAFLKIRDRCKRDGGLLRSVKEKVWNVYHAVTPAQFSQRIRRLRE
jgi:hypothetical protein